MSFANPAGLWLLALLPVIVALHLVRRRRRRYDVGALFLWQRAAEAVARRRRFSPSWLLAAQLLFTMVAAFAVARPSLAEAEKPDRVIIIDASASMTAVGPSGVRLDLAKREARELLDGAGQVAIVRAGTGPRLLSPLGSSGAERLAAIEALEAGDAAGDLVAAVALAGSLLPGAEVHVVTDLTARLGAAALHLVGEPVPNLGISAFDVGIGQAFVAVVSSDSRPAEVGVSLWQDGRQLARGTVLVPSGGSGSATFPLLDVTGVVEARLDVPAGDALALDDVAYAGRSAVRVVSDDAFEPLLRALAAVPRTQVAVTSGAQGRRGADLAVLARDGVDGLPPGNYLVFPPRSAEPRFDVIRDWNRTDALTRFADLKDVIVGLPAEPVAVPDGDWTVLARTSTLEPVISYKHDENGLTVLLGFHPSQSDISLRPAFPALVANIVSSLEATSRVRLGDPLPGSDEPLLQPGVHAGPDGTVVLASLYSAGESRLETVAAAAVLDVGAQELAAPAGVDGAGAQAALDSVTVQMTAVVTVLLVVALFVLLAEWLLYTGRLGRRLLR